MIFFGLKSVVATDDDDSGWDRPFFFQPRHWVACQFCGQRLPVDSRRSSSQQKKLNSPVSVLLHHRLIHELVYYMFHMVIATHSFEQVKFFAKFHPQETHRRPWCSFCSPKFAFGSFGLFQTQNSLSWAFGSLKIFYKTGCYRCADSFFER